MKSKILIAGLLCAATIPPTFAVTKCVKLPSSTTTCTSVTISADDNQSNGTANCDGVNFEFVGFCSSRGGSTGTTAAFLPASSTNSSNNIYCWCKMVSPAVSSWVFFRDLPGADCYTHCGYNCAYAINDASFRSGMFGSLSD